jgi:hypothetical protein
VTWLNPRFRPADAAVSTSESEESSRTCWSDDGAQPEAARAGTRRPLVTGDPAGDDEGRYSDVVCSGLVYSELA